MKERTKKYKNNPLLIIAAIILAIATISLIVFYFCNAYNEKRTSFSSYIESCETPAKADDEEDFTITANATTRTYRFFGYANDAPDMYTTLKLNSDNTYIFYINNCEGTTKYTGEYTETNTVIRLAGGITLDLSKNEDGTILNFDLTKAGVCHDSGGSFALEESTLEPPIVEEKEDKNKDKKE